MVSPELRTTTADEEMIRLVAELYYLRDQSQSAIAELTGYSVSKISRLLAQARDTGMVHISVQPAAQQLSGTADRVAAALRIEDAHVTPGRSESPAAAARLCAVAAAAWVEDAIPEAGVLGIAGGYTVAAMVDAFPQARRSHLTLVPLVGGWDPSTPHLDINEVTRRAAERLGARHVLLHAPGRLDSAELREALMRESAIMATTEFWGRLSLAIVGISGDPTADPGYTTVMDRLSGDERGRLVEHRVVGDLVGHLFDIDGRLVADPWTDRTIAIPAEALRRAARVIAIAAGPHKVGGIIGACRTGLIDSLVTDEPTAQAILDRLAATTARRPA
ncbi:MAG TPA: sugar-binding domain-containing protein [Candidatus Limnocylindria bacterium]|nr:sugar-binding domain-containing protein [Candidatus Limnocylindria bacterium]